MATPAPRRLAGTPGIVARTVGTVRAAFALLTRLPVGTSYDYSNEAEEIPIIKTVIWLVDAVGDPRIVPEMLKRLRESVFKQKDIKVRGRGQDGKPVVQVLRAGSAS